MSRPEWDEIWMQFADTIALRSKCSRAQVGCVIVDKDQNVLSASYNGPPSNYAAEGSCIDWCPRGRGEGGVGASYDNCPTVHAELNGISRLDKSRMNDSTLYVTHSMCFSCCKVVAASGISRVIHNVRTTDTHRDPDKTEEFLRACKIEVLRWPLNNQNG